MVMGDEMLYFVALTFVNNVGIINAKRLLAHLGCAMAVFKESKACLSQIHGIGDAVISSIKSKYPLLRAEKEIDYAVKNSIRILPFIDANYPYRLNECTDAP